MLDSCVIQLFSPKRVSITTPHLLDEKQQRIQMSYNHHKPSRLCAFAGNIKIKCAF